MPAEETVNTFTAMMSLENDAMMSPELKVHLLQDLENILFVGVCVYFSAPEIVQAWAVKGLTVDPLPLASGLCVSQLWFYWIATKGWASGANAVYSSSTEND